MYVEVKPKSRLYTEKLGTFPSQGNRRPEDNIKSSNMFRQFKAIMYKYYSLKCAVSINAISRRREIHDLVWVAFMREPFVDECAISLFIKCAHLGYDLRTNEFIHHNHLYASQHNVKASPSLGSVLVSALTVQIPTILHKVSEL
jgi:hypothetical protein